MFHLLCGSPSIPLSFTFASVIPRRETSRVSLTTARCISLGSEFSSFTAKITRVSNPNHSFSFRLSASGKAQYSAFAILVFLPISTHFTAPPGIPCTSTYLKYRSFLCWISVEPRHLTKDFLYSLQTLYAQSFRITLASSVLPRLLARS